MPPKRETITIKTSNKQDNDDVLGSDDVTWDELDQDDNTDSEDDTVKSAVNIGDDKKILQFLDNELREEIKGN